MSLRWERLCALGVVALAVGCGSSPPMAARKTSWPPGAGGERTEYGQRSVSKHFKGSYPVALVGPRTLGPHLVRLPDSGIVAYLGAGDDRSRRLVTVALAPHGEPLTDARSVASVPVSASTFLLRATGGARPSAVAAWVALTDRGLSLSLAGIGFDGTLLSSPVELARSNDAIVWVDIVPTPKGAVCLWAEQTRDDTVNLLATPLEEDGRPRGVPSRLVRGIRAWSLVKNAETPTLVFRHDGGIGQEIALQKLDAEGRALGAPTVVATKVRGATDVEGVGVPGGVLVGWTERGGVEPHARVALVGSEVGAPADPFEAAGASVLLGLAAGKAGVVALWEPPASEGPRRTVRLSRLELGPPVRSTTGFLPVTLEGRELPELVPLSDGFAFAAPVESCVRPGECDGTRGPAFVRLDGSLRPVQVEAPVTEERSPQPGLFAWDLACLGDDCQALFATEGMPTPVHAGRFAKKPTETTLPVPAFAEGPAVRAVRTLLRGGRAHDVAVAPIHKGSLVAFLTEGEGRAEPGSRKPKVVTDASTGSSQLTVLTLDAAGAPTGEPVVVTTRAFAEGGVAVVPMGAGVALAWVALEHGDPRVHVALVDGTGKRGPVVTLAAARGGAANVALAPVEDGLVVGWVDQRDGNGEVYAVHLTPDLRRGQEERITQASGDAGDLVLLGHRGVVWAAFTDSRESANEGLGDVYVARLAAKTAKRLGDEIRIQGTAAHSRSPSLAAAGDGLVLGWIEEAAGLVDASTSGSYGAMLAWLDARGRPVSSPQRFGGAAAGTTLSLTLAGSAEGVHAVLARSAGAEVVLDAALLGREPAVPKFTTLFTIDGPASLAVPMSLAQDALVFGDATGRAGEGRLRRLSIEWQRPR